MNPSASAWFFLCWSLLVILPPSAQAQTRDEKVRQDKAIVQANGQWIYNDLDLAMAEARRDNKPLLATFRCIP